MRREYSELLEAVSRTPRISDPLALFTTHVGSQWNHELMVCGRATNGGEPAWTIDEIATADARDAAIQTTLAERAKSSCSMQWITDSWRPEASYNTARSAFWRVSRAVIDRLGVATDSSKWSASLAWTNLYRVAPAQRGNPNGRLQRSQLAWCQGALVSDLSELRPKRLLVMTGSDWAAPFVETAVIEWQPAKQLIQGWGTWMVASQSISVVIAKHPERKPHEQFVAGVIGAFERVA